MWKCCRTIWRGNTSHSNYSFVLVFCAIFIFSFAFAIVSDIFITFIFTIQILIVQGDTVHERWAYFHFTHIFIMHASMVCVCFELFFQELKVPRLHELMGANEVNLILLSHKPTLMIIQYLRFTFNIPFLPEMPVCIPEYGSSTFIRQSQMFLMLLTFVGHSRHCLDACSTWEHCHPV